jgi:hypothetical protein
MKALVNKLRLQAFTQLPSRIKQKLSELSLTLNIAPFHEEKVSQPFAADAGFAGVGSLRPELRDPTEIIMPREARRISVGKSQSFAADAGFAGVGSLRPELRDPTEIIMPREAGRISVGECRGRDSNPHAPLWGHPILSRARLTNFATPARQE